MIQNRRILGIITARGGSKGVPGKNIRLLAGKPLIAWTIEEAQQSQYLDQVVVSTDDEHIAEISRQYGAAVPFLRPSELATDDASSVDVVLHALAWFEARQTSFDLFLLLQPTSPLRITTDIDGSIEMFMKKQACAVISVCEADHHPFWMNTLPEDGSLANFLRPEAVNQNRQQLPIYYRLNGALYVAETAYLKAHHRFVGDGAFAYIMPAERSIDIDTEMDFYCAEFFLRHKTHVHT